MKILFTISSSFNPNAGGVQRTTFKLGKYFTEQGLKVAYFSMANKGHVSVGHGILFHSNEIGGADNTNNLIKLKKVLNDFRPDFVINQMPYLKPLRETLFQFKSVFNYILLGCLRNSLFNFKNNVRDRTQQMMPATIFRILDNPIGLNLVKKRHVIRHRKDLKAIIDQHDKFILLAPPNRDEMQYFVGDYKKEKILSIPNSIPEVLKVPEIKNKTILHVGRLNIQQKRSDLLLKVWDKVYEKLPDWEFIIVGDGPYMESIETKIKDNLIPRVTMAGYQEPETFYKKAPIFMMPSAYEGFPNTLIEAQSYGCIPFAFDSYSALSWIVNDNQDAFLSPAFDVNDMAQKIVSLALDGLKTQKMQQVVINNAKRFTINDVGKIWLSLFEDLKVRT